MKILLIENDGTVTALPAEPIGIELIVAILNNSPPAVYIPREYLPHLSLGIASTPLVLTTLNEEIVLDIDLTGVSTTASQGVSS